jgi:ArsR family transcriptional regulator
MCPKKWHGFFRAIHNRQRQMILDIIKNHKEIHANGIVEKVNLSQPTVSHHLKILSDASIIKATRVGKEVVYSIDKESIHECCGGFMDKFAK